MTKDVTWIFTDSMSSDAEGTASALSYRQTAVVRGAQFFSVVLHCDLEENLRRIQATERGGSYNTKLADVSIVRSIRETAEIHHFNDAYELELDVTGLSSTEAAQHIVKHISKWR